ncbi:MAG: lipoprotein [Rhizobiaceae bacterium]
MTARLATAALLAAALAILPGCGRKGDLETPSQAAAKARAEAAKAGKVDDAVEEKPESKPFFLDFLID